MPKAATMCGMVWHGQEHDSFSCLSDPRCIDGAADIAHTVQQYYYTVCIYCIVLETTEVDFPDISLTVAYEA